MSFACPIRLARPCLTADAVQLTAACLPAATVLAYFVAALSPNMDTANAALPAYVVVRTRAPARLPSELGLLRTMPARPPRADSGRPLLLPPLADAALLCRRPHALGRHPGLLEMVLNGRRPSVSWGAVVEEVGAVVGRRGGTDAERCMCRCSCAPVPGRR